VAERTGILLVNLGTPDAPEAPEVRRYLREFLSDPRVLDIGPVARKALLELVILPRRPAKSAAAYRKVWMEEGSPLLVHSRALADAVAERMPEHHVVLAMRYGNPSLAAGFEALRECSRVIVFPLYPHYASSSTGSTIEAVYAIAAQRENRPELRVVPPFYDDPRFIEAFAEVGEPVLRQLEPDHVLMSFHGLPERHLRKADPGGVHCLSSPSCCDRVGWINHDCYRAQSFATARALAARLSLGEDRHTVCFQSRLGRTPWIKPFTDEVLVELARKGVKRLAVFCPAFVADCLETLEEIGIRAKEDFVKAGGEALQLVPSLNATPTWVDTVIGLLREADDPNLFSSRPRAAAPMRSSRA
jgi:ferrochelatase